MSWYELIRNGVKLRGFDGGQGPSIIFQHGLGGDDAQVAETFPMSGFHRLTLECRAHGLSQAGNPHNFTITKFTDDVLAFADSRSLKRFAVGGISMGAAIAMRMAVITPERVSALILARPAWMWEPAPSNMYVFKLLSEYLASDDKTGFEVSRIAKEFAELAPANHASLLRFFDRGDQAVTAKLLAAIAEDGPRITKAEINAIQVPTLVIGNAIDLVHPLSHAIALAQNIPNAIFVEIAPKALDKRQHLVELQNAVTAFLQHQGLFE